MKNFIKFAQYPLNVLDTKATMPDRYIDVMKDEIAIRGKEQSTLLFLLKALCPISL